MVSSHDVLNDPSLSKDYAVSPEVLAKEKEKLRVAEEKKEKLKEEIRSVEIKAENQTEEKFYIKFEEKMKNMLLKKRLLMDDIKKITDEDLVESDNEDPVIKGDDKKKLVRGLMQKTRSINMDVKQEESESGSSDEDLLTEEQKYKFFK